MNQQSLENAIEEFEKQFLAGNKPNILDFAAPDDQNQRHLFAELLHTELELKIRDGQDARVENYLSQFPAIAADDVLISELFQTEYKVRSKFEPGLCLNEFSNRLPPKHPLHAADTDFDQPTFASDRRSTSKTPATDSIEKSCSDHSSRFRKLRLHTQGGLGNIYLAHDREMKRTVAIKEIKEKFCKSIAHRERFRREQHITSKLDHPGIVPIYGVGYLTDGTPYFAMQFIEGMTLSNAISSFHENTNAHQTQRDQQLRHLLQHFIDACQTIDYANCQKIIHRDVKPTNIMIGQFGETYVIDWGLAKIGQESEVTNPPEPIHLTSTDNTGNFSVAGEIIGSPGYMSPEQTQGNHRSIGPHSDVYSLGATLWKIVANSLPETATSATQTEHSVSTSIRPLLSIASKATSTAPTDRHASAGELAEEVRRFLADELVESHQYSIPERVFQFTRKRNELVSAISIAGLMLTVLLTSSLLWINHERKLAIEAKRLESQSRETAEAAQHSESIARQRAEQRTSQLTSTMDVFADLFAGSDDSDLFLPLETTTLKAAITKIQNQIDDYDDPIKAFLYAVIARSNKGQGKYEQAIEDYEQSLELLSQNDIPTTDTLHIHVLTGLAFAQIYSGNTATAAEQKLQIEKILDDEQVGQQIHRFKLAMLATRLEIANGRFDNAKSQVESGLEIARTMYPDDPTHNNILWAKYQLASIHRRKNEHEIAVPVFEEIRDTLAAQSDLHPLGISARIQLAEIKLAEGKQTAAMVGIKTALADAETIFGSQHPDTLAIRSRLAALLTVQDDPKQRQQGIEELKFVHQSQLLSSKLSNQNVMATSLLLAKSLLDSKEPLGNIRAAEITSEYFIGEPMAMWEALETNTKMALQIAAIYTRSMQAAGQGKTAAAKLSQIAELSGKSYTATVFRKLVNHLKHQKKQTQNDPAGE